MRRLILAFVVAIAVIGGACAEDNRIEESPLATWDLSKSEIFFLASSGEGALEITPGCVRLIRETNTTLFVWTEPTSWNASSQLIDFVDLLGNRLELRDGDRIEAGDSGYPIVELTSTTVK